MHFIKSAKSIVEIFSPYTTPMLMWKSLSFILMQNLAEVCIFWITFNNFPLPGTYLIWSSHRFCSSLLCFDILLGQEFFTCFCILWFWIWKEYFFIEINTLLKFYAPLTSKWQRLSIQHQHWVIWCPVLKWKFHDAVDIR